MSKIMTLSGAAELGRESGRQCKCVYNPRTKRHARLCFVGKSKRNRSGWQFQKGGSQFCSRR